MTRANLIPTAFAAIINLLNVFGLIGWSADQVASANLTAAAILAVMMGRPTA